MNDQNTAPDTYNLIALSRLLDASLEYITLGTQPTETLPTDTPSLGDANVPAPETAQAEQTQEKSRPLPSQPRRKSRALRVATIVLAVLLVVQFLFAIWLYPQPWRNLNSHYLLSDNEVRDAANTLERTYFFRSLYTQTLLLNIRNKSDGEAEKRYLQYHPEIDARDLIIFQCAIFSPHTGGVNAYWEVAMERDSKGEWHIIAEGVI